jgi:signal transduction histidine kinase/DNA-binding response OmpR family regulator/ligand-binding sensor domain-containing protein
LKIKNLISLSLFISLGLFFSFAQENTFYHYGLEQGLSQQTIRCILKDSNGFLWLGTQDGLNRFDGTSFTIYKNQKKDSLTISGNFINTLLEDNDTNIWIGTNDNGISIYDSQLNSFRTTAVQTGNCSSLSKTSKGTIVATILNEGIFIFNNGSNNFLKVSEINGEKLQFSSTFVYNDILYVSTQDGRLFVSKNILSEEITFLEIELNLSVGNIDAIFVIDNEIWLGTTRGLFVFNKNNKELSKISLDQKTVNNNNLHISSIDVHENTFYIGSFDGLYIAKEFNEQRLKFQQITIYKGEQSHTNSITSNRVYDTFTDGDLLWIGTNNLDVVTLKEPVFKNVNTTSEISLNNAFILSFTKNDDYFFVGTRKGINCIDSKGNVTYITKENTNQALAFDVIRSMAIDRNNYMWVGTIKGVSVINLNNFDPKSPNIISFYHDINNSQSLSSDATRGIFVDHKGTIWIMTYGGGINRFTGDIKSKTITFEHYRTKSKANTISSNFTYNMSQDKYSNYWITSEDGLSKLQFEGDNYQNPKFANYFSEERDTTSLSSNTTLHTWHDSNGTLWVATQDGFNKFNSQNNTFKRYGIEQGLTNTFVYSITEDQDNNLWLTTNGGLFRFNKATEIFTNYTVDDGLQSSEFNLGAHYYNKETNDIYVGGINGINIFNPRKVPELDVAGNLTFTSLRIKNQEVNPLTNNEIIDKSITKTNEITLHYTDFPCYISFSDLDLRPTKNNQFLYSLDNTDWNDLSDSREIPLLDLPKGKHTIRIQGKSRNNLWQKKPLELQINVIPPWYKSNLAYFNYLLIFLLTIYQFYRLRLRQQLAKQEAKRLQELDNLKSRFITNITHEFRTPLTIIMGYVDTLKSILTNHPQANVSLKSIERNSHSLITLVNQMLDLAKLEQGQLNLNITQQDLISFTHYLVNSFTSLAESKKVKLLFKANVEFLTMDFDQEKWRQIVTNLLSNAIKFTKENSIVQVSMLKLKTNEVSITITDQGIGIPKADLPFVFDRFYQATNNIDKKISGTGIGLALTKELVELMDGSIVVNSVEQSGTTFSIKLPITTNSALQKETVVIEKVKSNTFDLEKLPGRSEITDANTILIVEDNEEIAHYIGTCLHNTYNLEFAANGEEGLALAETKIPDIIITDLMMPKMDGYTMTEELQKNSVTNHIPIIMLTAKAMQNDKVSGLKSGADAYLTKPFQKEELLVRIETLIAKRKKLQEKYVTRKLIAFDKTKIKTDKNLEFLERVVQHIHTNLENTDYNAAKLATDLYMSESQLYRKLKAVTNKSSAIFIRSVRLEKAKDLIESTTLSISEIAYLTGFSNPNWFGKAFKEEFGKNPSEFRN